MNLRCCGQGVFHIGAKLGVGGSVVPLHSTLQHEGATYQSYTGTTLSTGAVAQYIIANRFGIESGLNLIHFSYYYPEDTHLWRKRIWKGAAAVEMLDYQLPILLVYRTPLPFDPMRDFTFSGGTSLDCLSTDFLLRTTPVMWMKNIYCSIRIGKERPKGNRLEYGLELQYATDRFSLQGLGFNEEHMLINSRVSLLTMNLYYFFVNKTTAKPVSAE